MKFKFDKLLNIFIKPENRRHFTSAIVLAGGSGLRVGGDIAKQHIKIFDKEMIVHTLLAFERCKTVNEIIVVCRSGEEDIYHDHKLKYDLTKLTMVVPGRETRQGSALCGFEAIDKRCEYVIIHDGARCLAASEDITNVTKQAYRYRAAMLAKQATDTVKIADEKGFVKQTADRNTVYLAQTPQVFEKELYRVMAYTAQNDGFEATDDSMLAERLNIKVKLVGTIGNNMKVTEPDDIKLAEILLSGRNETE